MNRLINENTIIKMLNTMDRYTSEELTLCDTDKTFPKNEVFIVDDVFEGLDKLPSEQPESKWISCNKRLPEDGTEVFIYLFDRPSPYIAWIEDTHWYTEDFEVDREDEPIAWMPLPEPYKEEL